MILLTLLESGSTFECELLSDAHEEPPYSFFWEPDMRVTQKGRKRWASVLYAPAHLEGGNIVLEGVEDTEAYYDFVKNVAGYGYANEYDELFKRINLGGDE